MLAGLLLLQLHVLLYVLPLTLLLLLLLYYDDNGGDDDVGDNGMMTVNIIKVLTIMQCQQQLNKQQK